MAEERRPVSWKTGLAVGAGVVAAAGVAVIAYKLIKARNARRATSPTTSEPLLGESERTAPLNNGGAVPVGAQSGSKVNYGRLPCTHRMNDLVFC